MTENASVVVFPSIFAKNKLYSLVSNIKKILKIRNQQFQKIRIEDSIIVFDVNDPVFAESAVNLLFGIERVAIAKQVNNEFNSVVSAIVKIGSNLLLKGEKFYVKVEGNASGYLPKDIEIAATSSLIEKTIKLGTKPGTEEKHDKLLYTYITKLHAYVCIFSDKGHGGIPYNSQNVKTICCIYDELSAVCCLETIKEGFDVKIIVCFQRQSDLLYLVKILNNILPRTVQSKIELEFFHLPIKGTGAQSYLRVVEVVSEILISVAKENNIKRVSLAVSSLIFPSRFVDNLLKKLFQKNMIPHLPISGLDDSILHAAKEIGLAKYLPRIEKLGKIRFIDKPNDQKEIQKLANQALKNKNKITVTVGPTNIHDILDSLKLNH